MPPVPSIETVTSWKVATDNVAVMVTVLPEFSSIADELLDNVTVGALSLSVIVPDVLFYLRGAAINRKFFMYSTP